MPLSAFAARYDHLLLDLDGCVWLGEELTERAVQALEAWRAAGRALAFVTNETRMSEQDFVRKLWRLGVQASVEEVVTAGGALQHLLAQRPDLRTAFVIGAPAVWEHVEGAGKRIVNHTAFAERADVVVVAAHEALGYEELTMAVRSAARGAPVVALNRDATFPRDDGLHAGTGAVVAAVEYAAGVRAISVGKPESQPFLTALDRLGPGRALMVGDRVDADVAGAYAAGIDAALVLTGVTASAPEEDVPGLVRTAASLAELVLGP
ncbi:MAG TPA: HAD-IIA family hydrolase [Solirubrobacteraceae bacterium]|jgi:HAD superfamily hydrolase (TIGR01450 family)|nr:HAD-IIA family hydrolase [Solirubrobacteraceae bacterium]